MLWERISCVLEQPAAKQQLGLLAEAVEGAAEHGGSAEVIRLVDGTSIPVTAVSPAPVPTGDACSTTV
ncbi:MAG: hypothetical protein ACLR7Z_22040 [Bilophila wadsworthia]